MNTSADIVEKTTPPKCSKCLLDNWVEERATAALDAEDHERISKHGHKGILSLHVSGQVRHISTAKEHFAPPTGPGVMRRGIREELFVKHLYKTISEEVQKELSPALPSTEFISTTKRDYKAAGFQPVSPELSEACDYRHEQAITFWSENCQKIQGVTAIRNPVAPFKKNCTFSTPVTERLDEVSEHAPDQLP